MAELWQTIYSTNQIHMAEMVKAILSDNDIECVLFNQQDSMYLFGDIEVKVQPDDVIKAKFILKDI